jgi:hypothetical protein
MARRGKRKVRHARKNAQNAKSCVSNGQPEGLQPQQNKIAEPPENKARDRANRIFPRNLTAQAAYLVPGNPVVTRPEDAVANCFPGLELDIRNLDRRFFPGLLFEFLSPVEDTSIVERRRGAKLRYVAMREDPDLLLASQTVESLAERLDIDEEEARALYERLSDELATNEDALSKDEWYIDWIEQKGNQLSMIDPDGDPYDGLVVWRFVRGLEPGPVTICLRREEDEEDEGERRKRSRKNKRRKKDDEDNVVELHGWRRLYTDPVTGVINGAYQPGELMQGLCSPWQHDFRDCQCFYWAANHPDVVLGELYPGESLPPDDEALGSTQRELSPTQSDGIIANVPLDWIRADRSRALAAEALGTIAENRPYQLDAFKINTAWQDLSVVVEGREIGGLYVPQTIETANPFADPETLVNELRGTLAPLELALSFEYLYARFSLLDEDEARDKVGPELEGAVKLARDRLMLIATSEMQHLRWANQILWELFHKGLYPSFEPVLHAATKIPTSIDEGKKQELARLKQSDPAKATAVIVHDYISAERSGTSGTRTTRDAELRPLTREAMDDFIAVEHPSSLIDGKYARVVATLRQSEYPPNLVDLALRVVSDGTQHEIQFRQIKNALDLFEEKTYLRDITVAATSAAAAQPALGLLGIIKENLKIAYTLAGANQLQKTGEPIAKARTAMSELLKLGDQLAKKNGIGIPFFDFWKLLP